MGCRACKARKVKCDEARPSCRNCVLRKETCTYIGPPPAPAPVTPSSSSPSSPPPSSSFSSSAALTPVTLPRNSPVPPFIQDPSNVPVVTEPLYRPAGANLLDMKLLWWYTSLTYQSFTMEWGQPSRTRSILQHEIPRRAFDTPFLMDIVLCVSACHMQTLHPRQDVSPARAAAYRARAFAGYRAAIEGGRPADHAGLLAGSLILIAVAAQSFKEEAADELYILDWMTVWRGIGTVIELISPGASRKTGLLELFHRPAVDLEAAAAHVPGELLALVESIPPGDEEFPFIEAYLTTLQYLGGLHHGLRTGMGPILYMHAVTWFTYLPADFVAAAQRRLPRALVILAHYLPFLKILDGLWWLNGIADREVEGISRYLGKEWKGALEMPRAAVEFRAIKDVARVILGDPEWEEREIVEREEYLRSTVWISTEDECVEPPIAVPQSQPEWWGQGMIVERKGK